MENRSRASGVSRKRKHVALAESLGQLGEEQNAVVIGNCVSDSAIVRSTLLSGIEDTEGLASLPSHLSPADVRLWETAYIVDADLPAEELVTVLKVADALGDINLPSWVEKLADMLKATDWDQQHQAGPMLCSVFSLPPHLLSLLMTYFLTHPFPRGRGCLSKAISQLPPTLHPALLCTAAEASGDLSFSTDVADKLLLALPFIPVASPGLQHIDFFQTASPKQQRAPCSTLAHAALLARAASAHPALTRLCLTAGPLPAGWLRSFAACLAPGALPALADLTLCTDAHPSGCADTIACLRLLPALTSLDISFSVPSQSAEAPASISAYTRLAASPAGLSQLQSLAFREGAPRKKRHSHTDWPFRRSERDSSIHSFLSLISAPALTHLKLTVLTRLPARMHALQAQLARFTALETIKVIATMHPPSAGLPRRTSQPPRLPRLVELDVNGLSTIAQLCVGSAIAQLGRASLTSLSLVHDDCMLFSDTAAEHEHEISTPEAQTAVQREAFHFFSVLGACTGLQHLSLMSLPGAPHTDDTLCSRGLMPALSRLQQLTMLVLRPAEYYHHLCLDGHQVGTWISRQTRLRHLAFDGLRGMTIAPVQPVIDACVRLKHVTRLDVSFEDVTGVHVESLLTQIPSLKCLALMSDGLGEPEQAAQDVAELVDRFPDVEIDVAGIELD